MVVVTVPYQVNLLLGVDAVALRLTFSGRHNPRTNNKHDTASPEFLRKSSSIGKAHEHDCFVAVAIEAVHIHFEVRLGCKPLLYLFLYLRLSLGLHLVQVVLVEARQLDEAHGFTRFSRRDFPINNDADSEQARALASHLMSRTIQH